MSIALHCSFLVFIYLYSSPAYSHSESTITLNLNMLSSGGGAARVEEHNSSVKTVSVVKKIHHTMTLPEKNKSNSIKQKTVVHKMTGTTLSNTMGGITENNNGAQPGSGNGSGAGTGHGMGSGYGIASTNALDHTPSLVQFKNPEYPIEARKEGIQGIVVLKVLIEPDGKIKDVRIIQSIPQLDRAAVDAVRAWRFTAITSHGNPVYVWMIIPIRFRLK